MLVTVLDFPEGRVIVPFLRRRPQAFPRVGVNNELKAIWFIVGQQTFCRKCIFLAFLLFYCWRGKMTSTSSSSFRCFHFTANEMEDGNLRFSIKRKGQFSRIAFCVNLAQLAQLFTLSYLTTPWKMFPFNNTRALSCFSLTIDEISDTVYLIEGFAF